MLNSSVEYLKGVGTAKAELLRKELSIRTVEDLINHFPFRYVDRSVFKKVSEIRSDGETVQLKGLIYNLETIKGKRRKRLSGTFKDSSGFIELIWFQGISYLEKIIVPGKEYVVYGKVNRFKGKKTMAHPEVELFDPSKTKTKSLFVPVYPSTEKLNARGLDSKGLRKVLTSLFEKIRSHDIQENLSDDLLEKTKLCSRWQAYQWIHNPISQNHIKAARNRLKFEELFFSPVALTLR